MVLAQPRSEPRRGRKSCSGASVTASRLAGILLAAAEMVGAASFEVAAVEEEHCSVVQGRSLGQQVALASAEHCSPSLFLVEGRTPLSLFCVSAPDFRSWYGGACHLRHMNGSCHAFDRESGADRENVFGHASVFACAGVLCLLPLRFVDDPVCFSGAGGSGSPRLRSPGRRGGPCCPSFPAVRCFRCHDKGSYEQAMPTYVLQRIRMMRGM